LPTAATSEHLSPDPVASHTVLTRLDPLQEHPMSLPTLPSRRFLGVALASLLLPVAWLTLRGSPDLDGHPVVHGALDADSLIARIEAPRIPGDPGLAGLTLDALLSEASVPGVSVAVIHDFEVAWHRGYGVADVETGAPVGPETLFQAASISKPVTAMAALRLVREGRLDLDADVNLVLRSWKVPEDDWGPAGAVTPRSLFSHTSGADDGFGFPGYPPEAPRPGLVQILNGDAPSNVGPVRFARPPFQAYKYSGGGSTLMQLALEELTGEPFAALMRRLVLEPLGMQGSTFEQPLPEALRARAARAHDGAGRSREASWHVYPEQAAAGLWTTAEELARFVVEVQRAAGGREGAVLDRALALEMITPVGVGPFGVGLSVEKRGEGWYFGHGGSNRGFRGTIVGHVRKGYGAVILANGDGGGLVLGEIEARVASTYGWDLLDTPLRR
jgi:CubicO group peptidase (beta-lactamase class C family)